MARNTYKEDEQLESPFQLKHLLRSWVYVKKYYKNFEKQKNNLKLQQKQNYGF